MASSRKDSRGYVLKTGEFQRKDGRYSYSYTDKEGKRHTVYETSLAELRKKERQIIRDIEDGIANLLLSGKRGNATQIIVNSDGESLSVHFNKPRKIASDVQPLLVEKVEK